MVGIGMSILQASPVSSPPEYSTIIFKADPPPDYPGDEEPPSYASVCPEAVRADVWEEDHIRCSNVNRYNCPRPSWCRVNGSPRAVSIFDILLNVLALVFITLKLLTRARSGMYKAAGDYVPWICLLGFHVWWLCGSWKLLISVVDHSIPTNERRQLTITWKRVNWCIIALFGCPLPAIWMVVIALVIKYYGTVFGTSNVVILGSTACVVATIPFALRVIFYLFVRSFTETLT